MNNNQQSSHSPILITGATGFLGAWIIARLVGSGYKIIATDIVDDYYRLKNVAPRLDLNQIISKKCDVSDSASLQALVNDYRPHTIIHLAALQIPQCRVNPAAGARVNIIGHINVMEVARKAGINRVIYTSSIAAKPRGKAQAPGNLYGVFKKADEEIARLYWEDYGLPSLGLRPFVVYGIGRDQGETSAITSAIQAAALGKAYTIPFRMKSCFQYAGEVADIFAAAAGADWQGAVLSDISERIETTDDILAAIKNTVPDAKITLSEKKRLSPEGGFDIQPLKKIIGTWKCVSLIEGVRDSVHAFRQAGRR